MRRDEAIAIGRQIAKKVFDEKGAKPIGTTATRRAWMSEARVAAACATAVEMAGITISPDLFNRLNNALATGVGLEAIRSEIWRGVKSMNPPTAATAARACSDPACGGQVGEDDLCSSCGVLHGDGCATCDGVAFHVEGCAALAAMKVVARG